MNSVQTGEKRDLVLNPLEQAFLQDLTRGPIKTYVGPCVVNQTAQDRPVKFNYQERTYRSCNLDDAVFKVPIASEGDYIVLENPSRTGDKPEEGNVKVSPLLNVGRKVNIPGPCTVPLWPGQFATVVKGHNLRSNQYLLVRIYNEEEAKANWNQAVIKRADPAAKDGPIADDLSIGQLLIIKGTEVSFYIPPTGVEVLPDENGYVREALTLERSTYCILVDEDGNKRYERGPQVVFPEPTETFKTDDHGNKKFKALELTQTQGLHIKVIAPYNENKEGDELFITGRETAIYYPKPEHSIITYGDQPKYFATAIPAGEGRYVMNRNTGEVRTVKGPTMLLPDPRIEVMVRRILSDRQCELWYPQNNQVLGYNRNLREVAVVSPSARSGFVSEGDVQHQNRRLMSENISKKGLAADVGKALMPDEFTRSQQYTPPRAITLDSKYDGVPGINVWTGYAIMVVNKRGGRRVEQGPTTVLLDYDESLEVLELSTGKPKNTDKLEKTVYLRVKNNKVSDIVSVNTSDHVGVQIKLAYRVNFEGEPTKWFETENYVKLLCDHARSMLKGKIQKVKIEDLYRAGTDLIRDVILGPVKENEGVRSRSGMVFEENGMLVTDVEVLGITIENQHIAGMLEKAQHYVVESNITISQLEKGLEIVKRKEEIARDTAEAEYSTKKRRFQLEVDTVADSLSVTLAKISAELKEANERKEAENAKQIIEDATHNAKLRREKATAEQSLAFQNTQADLKIKELVAEAESVVKRFQAAQGGFSEALVALGNQDTLQKVAEAISVQNLIGGRNFKDVIGNLFAGSPVQAIIEAVIERGAVGNLNGK